MKLRWTARCERCKVRMPLGTQALNLHGRYWHLSCARAYLRSRRRISA